MKRLLFIGLINMTACDNNSDTIRSFIPGTYISQGMGEYSQVWDTLVIRSSSQPSNNYMVERRVTYQRLKEGKFLALERKAESWSCLYNDQDQLMFEQREGKVITFLPEQDALLVGGSRYTKIQ